MCSTRANVAAMLALMKVYLSVDIEGVVGIAAWEEARKEHADYPPFRDRMAREAAAACEGALAAGASELLVKDAHGSGRNLRPDDLPAPAADVQAYAAELLGQRLPPRRAYVDAVASMSPMARSFWAENRRVSNRLLCQTLGYQLLHPDFRSGMHDCWKREGFSAPGEKPSREA